MNITPTLFPVVFTNGVDTKTDKHTMEGSLLEAQNVYQEKTKSLRLRNGFTELSTDTLSGGQVTQAVALATFQSELTLIGNSSIYTYAPQTDVWIDKGKVTYTEVTSTWQVSNSYQQTSPDRS